MAYPKNSAPKRKQGAGRKRGRGKVALMAAKKRTASRSVAASAPKPRRAAKTAKPAKLSVEDRLAALEAWALESGAHLPHLYPPDPPGVKV